jgi:hypothetical protein
MTFLGTKKGVAKQVSKNRRGATRGAITTSTKEMKYEDV